MCHSIYYYGNKKIKIKVCIMQMTHEMFDEIKSYASRGSFGTNKSYLVLIEEVLRSIAREMNILFEVVDAYIYMVEAYDNDKEEGVCHARY